MSTKASHVPLAPLASQSPKLAWLALAYERRWSDTYWETFDELMRHPCQVSDGMWDHIIAYFAVVDAHDTAAGREPWVPERQQKQW